MSKLLHQLKGRGSQTTRKSTRHVYSRGTIRAQGTHCARFLRACLGAIRGALLGGHHCKHKGQKKKRGGQNQRWPTSGQGGYITRAAWGVPTASQWGEEPEVAHRWARWLHNPCRLGGSPPLQSGGQNWRWPTSGQGGYITLATWGV